MSPSVVMLVTLAGLVAGVTVFVWGVTLALQGALYHQPADRLPVRSLVAGLVVGSFLAGWTYLNTRASHRDKYGTILEFSAGTNRPVTEFDAVRRERFKNADGTPREKVVRYRLRAGTEFADDAGRPFARSTSDYLTTALVVPDGDSARPAGAGGAGEDRSRPAGAGGAGEEGRTIRLTALERDGVYQLQDGHVVFREDNGARTMTTQNLSLMVVPSVFGAVVAVGLNVLHFVAWFVAFFPVLKFTSGHAVALTAVIGGVSLFVLMPLLFNLNKL